MIKIKTLLHSKKQLVIIGAITTVVILSLTVSVFAKTQIMNSRRSAGTPGTAGTLGTSSKRKSVDQPVSSNPSATPSQAPSPIPTSAPDTTNTTSAPTPPVEALLSPAPSVSTSISLFTDPESNVAVNARAWVVSNPADAAKMNRLATTPIAKWFGEWSGNVQKEANNYVSRASASGQMPVLIAYYLPLRDCGSYSSGGAPSTDAYKAWVDAMANGIGQRQAIVVIEPDALAGMDCLSPADQTARTTLITYAVKSFRSKTNSAIYIDAGNTTWQTSSTMASRLLGADVAEATGFSLNVSNFMTTTDNVTYGTAISKKTGNKHFIVDTSRNGNGPLMADGEAAWCNPDGRAFGSSPTLQTGNGLVDGYLWLKAPGESDGNCNVTIGGTLAPVAGNWWPQYALMLATNSGW